MTTKRLWGAIYFIGMIAEIVIRAPYQRGRQAETKVDQRVTATERGLLAGIALAMFLFPLLYTVSDRLAFADYRLSERAKGWLGALGTATLGGALWVFWRAHRDLGSNWSPSLEITARQTLITRGIYGNVRHPMYSSQLLWGLAQLALLPNWLAGCGGLLSFLALSFLRVPREEQMMRDHFGDEYRAYCARTGRVLPRRSGER